MFAILVGPGARSQAGLALTLRSLEVNVLAFHPHPVILFYGAGLDAWGVLKHRTTCRVCRWWLDVLQRKR